MDLNKLSSYMTKGLLGNYLLENTQINEQLTNTNNNNKKIVTTILILTIVVILILIIMYILLIIATYRLFNYQGGEDEQLFHIIGIIIFGVFYLLVIWICYGLLSKKKILKN